jgi:hypothetical protein
MDRIKISLLHRSGNEGKIKVQRWYKYGFHPMGGNVQIKPNAHKWKVTLGLVQLRETMHQFRSPLGVWPFR